MINRALMEKRVRKFAKWLHQEQKIYIDDLLGKLGVEEKDHRRATSCIDLPNRGLNTSNLNSFLNIYRFRVFKKFY